jgi:hypothetical protein
MPDFKGRPTARSKTLREAYAYLRLQGFPDRDLFIYPQGEFCNFKGEILDQQPHPGDTVSPGERILLIAAVPGICESLPDLFIDHREGFHEEFGPRGGAKRLFAVFDSAFIKMSCRLDWARDIFSGASASKIIVDYMSALWDFPERGYAWASQDLLGFILPGLTGFLGTESALRVYIDSVLGIKGEAKPGGMQTFPIPDEARCSLGRRGRLGADLFIGEEFQGAEMRFDVALKLPDLGAVRKILPGGEGRAALEDILALAMPRHEEIFEVRPEPHAETLGFTLSETYLGYSTVAGGAEK